MRLLHAATFRRHIFTAISHYCRCRLRLRFIFAATDADTAFIDLRHAAITPLRCFHRHVIDDIIADYCC